MNIFQAKCDGQGVDIDLLKGNKIELVNADKYVRNIVNELKLDGERNKNIILKLQEEMKEKIGKLNEKFQEMKSMIEKESKSMIEKESKSIKSMIEKESKSIKSMIEKEFAKFKLDGERNKKSIGALEKKCEQQNQQIENKFVNATKERENKEKDLMRNIDQMKNKQTEMTTMSNKIDQTMKTVENKILELAISQNKMRNGQFVWIIDKINDKMKDAKNGINTREIYSDSFYTHKHGYKMCLSALLNFVGGVNSINLSVWFHLMKGEFDDILQWPFKYDARLSLINQQTGRAHVGRTVKYDHWPNYPGWNKPIKERNDGFGYRIIELKELSTNTNLTHNNKILIKCSVNIPS